MAEELKFDDFIKVDPKAHKSVEIEGGTRLPHYFMQGIIHITEEDGSFEVIEESFMTTHLTLDGMYLSRSDIVDSVEYELEDETWDIVPEVDKFYSFIWAFDERGTSSWTDWGTEYDIDRTTRLLSFRELDEKESGYMRDHIKEENERFQQMLKEETDEN